MPTYEPGLGCPGCSEGFYRPEERSAHIRAKHPELSAAPTEDMIALAQRARVSLGDIFSDRRHSTGSHAPPEPAQAPRRPKLKVIQGSKKPTVDELYEKHLAFSKGAGFDDPESVEALRAHEKSGGLTRSQANKVADQAYIGGGGSDWRSRR
jgi:hypothetical protein